jgi:uncharacterized SAM-binding protein YcdF (DUF218 family)
LRKQGVCSIILLRTLILFCRAPARPSAPVCGFFSVVSYPITRADVIVVLGGNARLRPIIAAELYSRRLADKILVSQTHEGSAGENTSDTARSRAALLRLGVPAGVVEEFGMRNRSTSEEAIALRDWSQRNAAAVFIIPSEAFSARRVRWIFRREFVGSPAFIQVPSFEQPSYNSKEWWKTDEGISAFKKEVISICTID